MTESTTSEVVLARSIRGGFAGTVQRACRIDQDGRCEIEDHGVTRTGTLDSGQVELLRRICEATDFDILPERIDTPVTRTDAFTWTYQVGDHRVAVRDADNAAGSLPPALHVIDAVVDAIAEDRS